MSDPYSILGVSSSASDDEIKKAYRDLARKYHPDNYHDNPLSDLAQEKMKEINEAYDAVTKARSGDAGYNGNSYTGGAYNNNYSSATGEFAQVRAAINSGNIALAEQLLTAAQNRNAEWFFLMGSVYYRKGWLDEARRCYQSAVSMAPGNMEYRQALNHIENSNNAYRPPQYAAQGGGCDACDICTAMMCANMCCRCS